MERRQSEAGGTYSQRGRGAVSRKGPVLGENTTGVLTTAPIRRPASSAESVCAKWNGGGLGPLKITAQAQQGQRHCLLGKIVCVEERITVGFWDP